MLPYEAQLTEPANYTSSTLKEVNGVKYSFAGWYDNEALAGEVFSFTGSMPAHNLVLHAKWTSEEHAVTYHTAMVGGTEKILKVEHGKPIGEGILEQPTGDGDFIGWYRKDGQKLIPFPLTEPVLGDLELFPIFDGQTFKVTYKVDSGVAPTDNNKYVFMSTAKVLEGVTAPAGKMFLGWKYDGQLYMPNQQVQVKGDVEFTAEFGDAVAQTKVTYDDGNGIQKVFENLVNNGKHVVKKVSDPELNFLKTDHHFIGWKLRTTDQIVQPETEVILDTTNQDAENLFIAQWELNTKKENCIIPNSTVEHGRYVQEEVDATWTENGWNIPECKKIECDGNYELDPTNNQCKPKTQTKSCDGIIPENATATTNTTFVQTWDGNEFAPAVMNWTNGANECGFACKENYTYNSANNTCVANTQACNVENGTGTQTWNGNGWGACENIQCAPNYHNVSDKCKADQKSNQTCNSIPNNAQWLAGNNGTVTQTWNGSQQAWLPSLTGNYNKM